MYTLVPAPLGGALVQRDADKAFIPDDPDNLDRQAYEAWRAAGNKPAEPVAPAPVVPDTISDRQFAQALALAGTITQDEALAWASRGELPKPMNEAIAKIPEAGGRRFDARMRVAGDKEFSRRHPVTDQLGALLGYDAGALDALWTRAAAL